MVENPEDRFSQKEAHFMETLFKCVQHMEEPTCDFRSTIDLILKIVKHSVINVNEAYVSDHKLVYCALET